MKFTLTILLLMCQMKLALSKIQTPDDNNDDDEENSYIFDFLWIPEKYYVHISALFNMSDIFYGDVRLEGMTTKETNHIYLHSHVKLMNGSIKVNGVSSDINLDEIVYNKTNDMLLVNLNKTLASHQYFTLMFHFCGNISTKPSPFYLVKEIDGAHLSRPILTTEFQPTGARAVFPCVDLPRFKVNLQIKISSNAENYIFSNMPFKTDIQEGQDKNTIFYQTPKMSTYIMTFIVFGEDLKCAKLKGENQFCYLTKEKDEFKDQLSVIPIIRNCIANFTNIPYMLPKLDQVVVGKKDKVAMESWGLIAWRNHLFVKQDLMTLRAISQLYEFMAHEIAHQWFGNLVTCKFWCYIWLNEGVVTYIQSLIVNQIFPEFKSLEFLIIDKMWDVMLDEMYNPWRLVNEAYCPEEKKTKLSISYRSYKKGASILHMVAKTVLTMNKFQKALQSYLKTYQYSTVVEKDFWMELEMQIDKPILLNLYANNSLADYMKTWTHNKGYPLVFVQRNSSKIYVRQERFNEENQQQNLCEQSEYWWIPITYTISSKLNFVDTSVKQWMRPNCLSEEIKGIRILPNEWIILNIQHAGYYRVIYDLETYNLLTKYLIESHIDVIHPLNRAQLINDAFELAVQKYLNIDVPLNLTKYMIKETHFYPFYAATIHLKNLVRQSKQLPLAQSIKNYLKKITSVAYERIISTNFTINDINDYRYKIETIDLACELQFPHCEQQASFLASAIIKGEKTEELIIPELRPTLWCAAVRRKDQSIVQYILKKVESLFFSPQSSQVYYDALTCSRSPDTLYDIVRWIFTNYKKDGLTTLTMKFPPQDTDCVVIKYMTDHIDYLINHFGREEIGNRILELSITTKLPLCSVKLRTLATEKGFMMFPDFSSESEAIVTDWFDREESKHFLTDFSTFPTVESLDGNNCFLKQDGIDFFKIPTDSSK